jgi:hypothetical protein
LLSAGVTCLFAVIRVHVAVGWSGLVCSQLLVFMLLSVGVTCLFAVIRIRVAVG